MTAKIYHLPRDIITDFSDGDLLAALGIKIEPETPVDHWAGYRAQRTKQNRAGFKVVK